MWIYLCIYMCVCVCIISEDKQSLYSTNLDYKYNLNTNNRLYINF